ncbi:MAG: ATP-binding cassette domain-containing protein [Rhodospirillales bacterium]|nr:MAG: ATP-binding cassette domain-containing protein [Rhodospirillales bacterium]
MEPSIFGFILRYSKAQQIWLLAVIVLSYPFLYLALEMPKVIVNQAIGATSGPPFDVVLFGSPMLSVGTSQIEFLIGLSFVYLFLVLVNGVLKYYINVFKGRLGERLLRRLRYQLYQRILRFPLPQFRKVSQGELIPMITAEVEPLGGFIGTAFADPMFQGGQLLIILGFIMVQDPILGTAAIALYPLQIYVIPKLQRRVNELGKQRVQNVRRLSDHIGETVSGITELRAHDSARHELSRFASRLGIIYWIRFDIYRIKFFMKFLNNFIDKLTPFFFFSIGGWLVIEGELSFGALVAVLAAYKDLAGPWKEMLTWYQQKEDVRIKYGQVIEQFDPPHILDEETLLSELDEAGDIAPDAPVVLQNVGLVDDDGVRALDGVTLDIGAGDHVAVVGTANSGKGELVMAIAGLLTPTSGSVMLDDRDIKRLPRAVTGRRIAYVGPSVYVQAGSLADALAFALKHEPTRAAGYEADAQARYEQELHEAEKAGNTTLDFNADWIDYASADVAGPDELEARMLDVLRAVDLDDDIYARGLRGTIEPEEKPDVARKILEARAAVRDRLADPEVSRLVEPFDAGRYNLNASVAENLIFGVPLDETLSEQHIAANWYVRRILERVALTDEFLKIGRHVAQTMVELFADLPPGHEFFERFSFISAEDLPEFHAILGRAARGLDALGETDRDRLIALPFKLIPARHRLDLIDKALQSRLLEARRAFAEGLPDELTGRIAFFDPEAYNPGATIQDNILFGKIDYGQANAAQRVGVLIAEVLEGLGLRDVVMSAGLRSQTGPGGSRLSPVQRQKIGIARCLLKRPRILLVNEAAAGFDARMQNTVVNRVLAECGGRTVVWVLNNATLANKFPRVVVMDEGRIAEDGSPEELADREGGTYRNFLHDL